jgi:hypothetical protein
MSITGRIMRHCSYSLKQSLAVRQRMFELSFQVTTVRASLYKSQGLAGEKPLGHVAFDNFSLLLLLTQHDMKVGVCLGSVPIRLIGIHTHTNLLALFSWKSQSQASNLSNFSLPLMSPQERTFFVWTTHVFRALLPSTYQIMKGTIRSSLWTYLQSFFMWLRNPS